MFKKIVIIFTVVAILCSVMSVGFGATASYTNDIVYGDADGNGTLDTQDARLALKIASGIVNLENDNQLKCLDINNDGHITVFDVRQILRGVAGVVILQPSGAFSGFDGGTIFKTEDDLVLFHNAVLNRIKVTTEDSNYFAASIVKAENDELVNFDIKEIEIPAFNFGTSAESIANLVKDNIIEDDNTNTTTTIPYGETDFELMSVEGENYVSDLTSSDVFGSKASFDADTNKITIEIALPDAEIDLVEESAYAKILNAEKLLEEQDSTIFKIIGGTKDTYMLRQLKNCVIKTVVDATTGNVLSYEITFESSVYISQASLGSSSFTLAKLKGVEYKKVHTIVYDDFQWPVK